MKVFIDSGHGGKDPGAVGNGLREKDIALNVGLLVGKELKRHNVKAYYSRTKDIFVELVERAKRANRTGANLFVSIHANSFSSKQAQGLETYSHPSSRKGATLARDIQESILKDKLYTKDRGIKTANFSVLRNTKMPAALVELGFISNVEDANILRNKQAELAKAVARGILKNLGIDYVEGREKDHWADKHFKSLNDKGIKIHEKRFNDNVTRAEVFALLDRATD